MKILSASFLFLLAILTIAGCSGKGSAKKNTKTENDTVLVPDTGYTGIKQYTSGQRVIKEVTFKNGVRHGLMKSFYQGGQLYQTFWYKNGLREDSVTWYYLEGQIFRSTPYKHDTVDGIQKQYYRNGKLKARIGYSKGLRTPYFEEYYTDGKRVKGYPEIATSIRDEYSSKGLYNIGLELSDKSTKVKFYQGEFTDNRFDTAACKKIITVKGKGTLTLKKTGTPGKDYVGVIAEIVTDFGNRYLTYKKIALPYNDLK